VVLLKPERTAAAARTAGPAATATPAVSRRAERLDRPVRRAGQRRGARVARFRGPHLGQTARPAPRRAPPGRGRLVLVALRAHDRGGLPAPRRGKAQPVTARCTRSAAALAAFVSLTAACAAHAQEAQDAPAQPDPAAATRPGASAENAALANEMTPELHRAVDHGLRWLAANQNADGS